MKFLVDAQLPPALAEWFRAKGYEAAAVRDIWLRDADYAVIWARAASDADLAAAEGATTASGPEAARARALHRADGSVSEKDAETAEAQAPFGWAEGCPDPPPDRRAMGAGRSETRDRRPGAARARPGRRVDRPGPRGHAQ